VEDSRGNGNAFDKPWMMTMMIMTFLVVGLTRGSTLRLSFLLLLQLVTSVNSVPPVLRPRRLGVGVQLTNVVYTHRCLHELT